MNTLEQSQQLASWVWDGGRHVVAGVGKVLGSLVAVMHAVAMFYEEQEAHERSLHFEERLQRTGRESATRSTFAAQYYVA